MSKSQFQKEYEEYKKYKDWQEMLGCKNAEEVIDFVMSNYLTEDEKCRAISDQAQQIKDLEHRLVRCIEPKFKIGQEVWLVLCDGVKKDVVENNYHLYSLEKSRLGLYESCLYATEEEARKHLEELKNG